VEEWESGSTPYIASGEILQQTVPTALNNEYYVFQHTGVYENSASSLVRIGVVGVVDASGGNFSGGEYDSNVAGVHLGPASVALHKYVDLLMSVIYSARLCHVEPPKLS